MPFSNCNSETNGEKLFWETNKDKFNVVFDVGCRKDSLFYNWNGEVHYFDPVKEFVDQLSNNVSNKKSFLNSFGLSDKNEIIPYYPAYDSFFNRTISCRKDDSENKIFLEVKKAIDYVNEKNITYIDFLKIDTEGHELHVLKGFEDKLNIVKTIQFEYGGTFLDNDIKLIEVITYLEKFGFSNFSYLTNSGIQKIIDFKDHYQYCNIVCFRL